MTEMEDQRERSDTPVLDEWIAEVGEDAVVAAVRATEQAVEEGSLPAYSDRHSLLQHWRGGRRQSA